MATITACNGIVECKPKYNVLIDNSFHFNAEYCCEGEKCIDPCKFSDLSSCNLKPCVKIRWGDSPNDQLETDDVEIMCLEFSKCSNIKYAARYAKEGRILTSRSFQVNLLQPPFGGFLLFNR